MIIVENYIGGTFQPSVSNEMIQDFNPATGELIASIPRSIKADVDRAVNAAQAAQHDWQSLTRADRIAWVQKIAEALKNRKEALAQLESLDTGKPIAIARTVDAYRSIANFEFFAEFALSFEDPTFESNGAINYVHRSPIGTVGLITPWNLPLYLLSWKVAPALIMGNTIIAKPSELTPLTANLLAQVCEEIGLPAGVLNIVHGYGPEVGQAIVEHPFIRGISFTGGTSTGKLVAATAGPMFKKMSLELGGKNATILLDDAPIEEMMEGVVRASFTNSGQICLCGSRILVHESKLEAFTSAFVEAVETLTVGDPTSEKTQMGSLISIQHREKVESYISLAIEEGGYVLTGGTHISNPVPGIPESGAFLRPTVIGGLSVTSRTASEEIFGPVVTIHAFSTDDEAIEMANCTEYGLAGSVWTGDVERGYKFAQRIESGIVWVNTWLNRDLRTPFGGVKQSGVGREGGTWSLNFFSELTNICVQQ